MQKYFEGRFEREAKNRFSAWIELDGVLQECYVPTSSKLGRLLPLKRGLRVKLFKSERGRLELVAICFGRRWVFIRSSLANELLALRLRKNGILCLRENTQCGYKFDIVTSDKYYEVKSILSLEEVVSYPNAPSDRREKQIDRLYELVSRGESIELAFVSLSPFVRKIIIDKTSIFGKRLLRLLSAGASVSGWRLVSNRLVSIEIVL